MIIRETVPLVKLADIQSAIFTLLASENITLAEKDILDYDFHILRYRIKQLKKYQEDIKREMDKKTNK
jgi:hypothetical protein